MSYLDKSLKEIHAALKDGKVTSKEVIEESIYKENVKINTSNNHKKQTFANRSETWHIKKTLVSCP